MQCECLTTVKEKLKTRIESKMPEGSRDLSFAFAQQQIGLDNDMNMYSMIALDIKGDYQAPKKGGGFKRVKINTFVSATYCPFCGVKCRADG